MSEIFTQFIQGDIDHLVPVSLDVTDPSHQGAILSGIIHAKADIAHQTPQDIQSYRGKLLDQIPDGTNKFEATKLIEIQIFAYVAKLEELHQI